MKEDWEMKKKGLVLILACFIAVAALFCGSANAAWYTCTVGYVGSNSDNFVVSLADTGGTFNTAFYINPASSNKNGMLATALTAMSSGNNVSVWVDTTTPYSIVYAIIALN